MNEPTIAEIKEYLRRAPGMITSTRYIRWLLDKLEPLYYIGYPKEKK